MERKNKRAIKIKVGEKNFWFLLTLLLAVAVILFSVSLLFRERSEFKPSSSQPQQGMPSPVGWKGGEHVGFEKKEKMPLLLAETKSQGENLWQLVISLEEESELLAYQIELFFDPAVFRLQRVEKGDFLPSSVVLENFIDNSEGKVVFSVGVQPDDEQDYGFLKGRSLALFLFDISQKGEGEVYFGPKTILVGPGWYWENSGQILPPVNFLF